MRGRLPNALLCSRSGLQHVEVEGWLYLKEMSALLRRRRMALQQLLPGEGGGLAGQQIVQRLACQRQRPVQLLKLDSPLRGFLRRERQHPHDPTKTGVVRELGQDRFCLGQSRDGPSDIGRRCQKQSVANKKIPAVRSRDFGKELGASGQRLSELLRRLLGVFGGRRGYNR